MLNHTPEPWNYEPHVTIKVPGVVTFKGEIVADIFSNEDDGRLISFSPRMYRALQEILAEAAVGRQRVIAREVLDEIERSGR